MNRSAQRQQHEKARKRHRQQFQEQVRESSKKPKASMPAWFLAVGIGLMLLFVIGVSVAR